MLTLKTLLHFILFEHFTDFQNFIALYIKFYNCSSANQYDNYKNVDYKNYTTT